MSPIKSKPKRIRITNVENAFEHLQKAMVEAGLAMEELKASMVDYRLRKPETVKKEVDKEFGKMKEVFMSYYRKNKEAEYYWNVVDAVHLNKIISILRTASPNCEITPTFEVILDKLQNINPWVYSNLTISILSSKMNIIIASMLGGNKYKQEILSRLNG